MTIYFRRLTGRCADGFERGGGRVWHAVRAENWSAMCGVQPGRASAGWSEGKNTYLTCPRCIKIMGTLLREQQP